MFVYRRNRLDRSEPESAVICFAAAATFRRFGSVSADAKFVKVGSNEKILRETKRILSYEKNIVSIVLVDTF